MSVDLARPRRIRNAACTLTGVLTPLLGAVGSVMIGGLVLYAKSRGWTAEWEREHLVVSNVALMIMIWSAAASLVFLCVLGLFGVTLVAPSIPWVLRRALEVAVVGAAGIAIGRLDSFVVTRRALERRSRRLRFFAPLMVAFVGLQWLLRGASAVPWAASVAGIALLGVAIGRHSQHGPASAAGN